MTATALATREVAPSTSWRRFARHYLVMVVAMYTGMLVLNPVYAAVAARTGHADPWAELPVVSALVMAVNMTLPMVLLMLHHGHGRLAVVERPRPCSCRRSPASVSTSWAPSPPGRS